MVHDPGRSVSRRRKKRLKEGDARGPRLDREEKQGRGSRIFWSVEINLSVGVLLVFWCLSHAPGLLRCLGNLV